MMLAERERRRAEGVGLKAPQPVEPKALVSRLPSWAIVNTILYRRGIVVEGDYSRIMEAKGVEPTEADVIRLGRASTHGRAAVRRLLRGMAEWAEELDLRRRIKGGDLCPECGIYPADMGSPCAGCEAYKEHQA
jgi:hypothetical protein